MERGMQVVLIAMLFALVCQSVGAASFSAGNVVEVLNAGSIGLKVRDAPCLSGSWDGVTRKFDGARGSVLQSSTSCDGYIWWKIRWSDGREGWTADGTATEQWLRSVSISPSTKFSLNNQVQVTDTGVNVRGSIPDLASIGSV